MARLPFIAALLVLPAFAVADARDQGVFNLQDPASTTRAVDPKSDVGQDGWISEAEIFKNFGNVILKAFLSSGLLKIRPDPTDRTLLQYKVDIPSPALAHVEHPKTPGCYVITASGCPVRSAGPKAGVWMKDRQAGSDESVESCVRRKDEFDRWCLIADSRMLFVGKQTHDDSKQEGMLSSGLRLPEEYLAQNARTDLQRVQGRDEWKVFGYCREFCSKVHHKRHSWNEKCEWPSCKACSECSSVVVEVQDVKFDKTKPGLQEAAAGEQNATMPGHVRRHVSQLRGGRQRRAKSKAPVGDVVARAVQGETESMFAAARSADAGGAGAARRLVAAGDEVPPQVLAEELPVGVGDAESEEVEDVEQELRPLPGSVAATGAEGAEVARAKRGMTGQADATEPGWKVAQRLQTRWMQPRWM